MQINLSDEMVLTVESMLMDYAQDYEGTRRGIDTVCEMAVDLFRDMAIPIHANQPRLQTAHKEIKEMNGE